MKSKFMCPKHIHSVDILGFSELRASGKPAGMYATRSVTGVYIIMHIYLSQIKAIYSTNYVMSWAIQSPCFSAEFSY